MKANINGNNNNNYKKQRNASNTGSTIRKTPTIPNKNLGNQIRTVHQF